MQPAMYIFLNKSLGMSTGKAAAQASHAAVEAYRLSLPTDEKWVPSIVDEWYKGGHYMKLVMEAQSQEHLLVIERYLNDRGFKTALIIDEGHTEIAPITATALGVEIVDKDDPHTAATFESFVLYKEKRPTPPETSRPDPLKEEPRFWFCRKKPPPPTIGQAS